jgi:pantoate--beta-alanine ligase
MSSRNAYLGADERERALSLFRALRAAERTARAESLEAGIEAGRAELAAAGVKAEYLEARDPDDLTPVAELNGAPVLIAVAARVGGARLIDNVLVQPEAKT